jgi:N-sulfoglucosamine sulfohydrolase
MDSLAGEGTLFRNAFVAYPVCSVSKACIYTALHNHRSGILNNTVNYHVAASQRTPAQRRRPRYVHNRIAVDISTLSERLRDLGYYQAATHKLHVAPVEKFPYDEFLSNPDGEVIRRFLQRASDKGPMRSSDRRLTPSAPLASGSARSSSFLVITAPPSSMAR